MAGAHTGVAGHRPFAWALAATRPPKPSAWHAEHGAFWVYFVRSEASATLYWATRTTSPAASVSYNTPAANRSLSYVGEPECNGVIERFMRTLKEQCLYLHQFASLEDARNVIGAFIHRYNITPSAHCSARLSDAGRSPAAAWAEAT
jgi:hypothetical protein